ncbi:ECHDC1 [Bugula neritina]|uniref:ECHDC1 n=1 Tax=Bugula neritina TaxID=10212 RepID=A0A7J7IUW5_BUGNE|nr:ECHDC1 [Bugula neritina]
MLLQRISHCFKYTSVLFNKAYQKQLLSTASNLNLTEIREQLSQFQGGHVDLSYRGDNGCIAVISLLHSGRMNALTGSMCVSLYDIIRQLSTSEEHKAVVVRGLQGHFCAGADLNMLKKMADPANGERFSYFMQETLCSLRHLPTPIYAAVQGNVLGAGAELLVACDFVIASPQTNIQFVQGRMGIVPGLAGAVHLVEKVGYHKALDILLMEKGMDANTALSKGLVDYLLPPPGELSDDILLDLSLEVIEARLKGLAPQVIRGLKSVAINSHRLSYSEAVTHERNVFKSLWGAESNLQAFRSNIKHKKK